MRWLLPLLVACGSSDDAANGTTSPTAAPSTPTTATTTTSSPTTSDPSATVAGLQCTVQADNALRLDCTVTLTGPSAVTVTASANGEDDRVWASEAIASDHPITLYRLAANTTWSIRAVPDGDTSRGSTTEASTGALPARFDLVTTVTDNGATVDEVLLNYGCDGSDDLVILDRRGRVVWYQDSTNAFPPVGTRTTRGFSVTPRQTLLVTYDRTAVAEWDLGGHLVRAWTGAALPGAMHHDLLEHDGWVYAVFAEAETFPNGVTYVLDGFVVWDAQGAEVARFRIDQAIDPTFVEQLQGGYWNDLFPGGVDFAHVNALAVDAEGNAWLSLHQWDALLEVRADPTQPDFGAAVSVLGGGPRAAPIGNDWTLSSALTTDLGFESQHHVSAPAPGELMLFDNGKRAPEVSRVLRFALDPTTLQAEIVDERPMDGLYCSGQGSAFPLPSGNVLADCAPEDTLLELTEAGEVAWRAEVACPGAPMGRPLYRAVPLSL
jgi:hypothetical protein